MNETTSMVVKAFEAFRMTPTPIDQFESIGRSKLEEKINPWILSGLPIEFVMLGYPFKSINDRDKVIGKLPDLAEEVSFSNFKRFNNAIKKVYAPGVNVNIISDGLVFNDALKAEDRTVLEYGEGVRDLAKGSPLTFYDLRDFWSRKLNIPMVRNNLMNQFAISEVELERRILLDADVNYLYRGMMRFMEEELAIWDYPSRNQLHKYAKLLTRTMMMRNEAYSELVRKEFPDAVRLSMHPSVNNGAKYSFQLIPSPRAWTSPWHAALLVGADGQYATVHRKDALAAGYELEYRNGRPYNFVEN